MSFMQKTRVRSTQGLLMLLICCSQKHSQMEGSAVSITSCLPFAFRVMG